jgi:hypothetical protein
MKFAEPRHYTDAEKAARRIVGLCFSPLSKYPR